MHLSLASVLQESALRRPDKVAVVEGPQSATYAELWDAALRVAGTLRAAGVEPGDRVALLGLNTIDFVTAYYGILARGAVVVPVAPMLVADEVAFLVGDSGAKVALVADDLLGVVAGADVEVLALSAARADAPEPMRAAREPLDPAVLFYTSGTTGRPKGAMLTHANIVSNAVANAYTANDIVPEDVMLGCLPLFHAFGQQVAMNATVPGGGTLLLDAALRPGRGAGAAGRRRRHDVRSACRRCTWPCSRRPSRSDGARQRCVSPSAAARALPVRVLEEFKDVLRRRRSARATGCRRRPASRP